MPTIDNWRSTLMRAAINCQHRITSESVSLAQSDEQSDGNALAQLADRLGEAVKPLLDERDRLAAEVEALRADAERLNWLDGAIFVHRWNGVIDSGSRVNWSVAGDYRHTCNNMVGNDFRAAIDAAMKGKP